MTISKLGMTGGSYGGIFYAVREKDALVIGGTFCGDKRDILAQSAAWNRTRPDVESNMIHLIESYPIDEEVSDEIMLLRAEEKLKRLGLKDCPFLLVKHTDKSHAHAHLLVSRIRSDGSIIDDSNIAVRSIAVTKELDKEFGMHETPFYFRAERIGRKEYEMMKRTDKDSQNQILRNIIQQAAQKSEKSFEKFLTNLEQEKVGFWLYLNEQQTNVKGIAFDCKKTGHTRGISGSRLGEGFKFPALSKQIGYRKEKDFPKLIDKYQLKLKSEIQPKTKKPKRADEKETYVLVSRAVNGVTVQDENPAKVSDENQRENSNDSANVETIEKLEIHPKPHATKTDAPAGDFQPPDYFPGSIAGGENPIPKIEKNEHREFTEPSNSDEVLLRGREAQLFYRNDAEGDSAAPAEDDLQATARFIKSLQNKIDAAQNSAESFSGFLRNLQSKKIICLPEIDDDRRVFDFVFIKKGIALSSGELGEDYKFQALARKLDYADKPIFVEQQKDPDSFQAQAAALRYKPISDYWWKIKAETDDKGRVTISPAAFEFLRVAYKGTFQTDVENFEDSFTETGTADQFLQKLDNMQKHVGIYTESVALLNKKLAEGRQTHGDGSLIILANQRDEPHQATRASLHSVSRETNSVEQKQPDETYAEFRSIFKQAGLEKILEAKSGTAELETVGENPARYEITFSEDEIKFFDVKDTGDTVGASVKTNSITFRRDEFGDFQPAAGFELPDNLYPEAAARYIEDDASKKISLLKSGEFAENIIVARLDVESDSRAEIKQTNEANVEKYVSRQLGRELTAEIALRTAKYNENVFRDNVNDERTIAVMSARHENQNLAGWISRTVAGQEKIVVNVRAEQGELKLENWRVKNIQGNHEHSTVEENQNSAVNRRAVANEAALRPLINKINPLQTVRGTVAWTAKPKEAWNVNLNPIDIIKNDPAAQVARAVAGYIERFGKEDELNIMAERTTKEAKILREQSAPAVAAAAATAANADKLIYAVKSAVEAEEALRADLKTDPAVCAELLETPERDLTDADSQQAAKTAIETGDARGAGEYLDLVKNDREFAAAADETAETLTVKLLLAEARAVWQAKQSIESAKPLPDGSFDVEINPAQFNQALAAFETADAFEAIQLPSADKSTVSRLSLEEIERVGQFLIGNNELTDALNNQIYNLGQNSMGNLLPPLNSHEQRSFNDFAFTPEMQQRFGSIAQSERFLDEMAQQVENDAQNTVPFQAQQARNLTVTNPHDALDAKESEFWRNDRFQREAIIANEKAAQRQTMTEEEKTQMDAADLADADASETVNAEERVCK